MGAISSSIAEEESDTDMMKMHKLGKAGALIVAAMAATAFAAVPSSAQEKAPEKPKGAVEVTLVVEGGKAVKGATVNAANRSAKVDKAGAPTLIEGVEVGRTAVTADAQIVDGKATRRFLGVAETAVSAGETVKVTVTVAPFTAIDAFCSACHPDGRDPKIKAQPGMIFRDIHVTNKALGDKYLTQVKAYNEKVARLEKEGKPHDAPIVLDERVVKVGGKEKKQLFFTCESCHTLHADTPNTVYARAAFRDKADLCVGCHY